VRSVHNNAMASQELQGRSVVECLVWSDTVIDILPVHKLLVEFTDMLGTHMDLIRTPRCGFSALAPPNR